LSSGWRVKGQQRREGESGFDVLKIRRGERGLEIPAGQGKRDREHEKEGQNVRAVDCDQMDVVSGGGFVGGGGGGAALQSFLLVQWSATCRASRLQVVTHAFLSPSYMFFLTNDRLNLSSCRQQLEMWEHG